MCIHAIYMQITVIAYTILIENIILSSINPLNVYNVALLLLTFIDVLI